jgi:FkbM family methyltransferase
LEIFENEHLSPLSRFLRTYYVPMLGNSNSFLKLKLRLVGKKFFKEAILILLSLINPRVTIVLVRILQQRVGFGYDSGLTSEVDRFAREAQKFKLKNPVVLDVGANLGDWSNEFNSRVSNCVIHAFEPSKETYLSLMESTKESPNINVYNFGLGGANNSQKLYYNEEKSGMASLSKRDLKHFGIKFEKFENVEVIRLDGFLEENSIKPDFVKIDVEGHELAVLEGLGDYINDLKVIQFEFGGTDIDSRTFFHDFWIFFEGKNFDLYRLAPRGLIRVDAYREIDEVFSFTTYFAISKGPRL